MGRFLKSSQFTYMLNKFFSRKKVKSQKPKCEELVATKENNDIPDYGVIRDVDEFCPLMKIGACSVVNRLKSDISSIEMLAKIGSWKYSIVEDSLSWSEQTYNIFERTLSFPITINTFFGYIHSDDKELVRDKWSKMILDHSEFDIEHRIITTSGAIKWVRTIATARESATGAKGAIFGVIQDITERRQHEDSFRRMSTIFSESEEGSIITTADGTILNVNASFIRITGYTAEELLGKNPRILKSGLQTDSFYKEMWSQILEKGRWQGEIWNKRKDGEIYPEHLRIFAIKNEDDEIINFISLFSDITESKKHFEQMQYLAYHDTLTGLPNRTKLGTAMQHAIIAADATGLMCAVAYLDLDSFKPINDKYGHAEGDQILKEVSNRISKYLRNNDLVARIGGDEFVILFTEVKTTKEVDQALHRICSQIYKPYQINDTNVLLSSSIGVTIYPADKSDADTLMRHADEAMYDAKHQGKNQIKVFDPEEHLRKSSSRALRKDIHAALMNNELMMYWQPYFNLKDETIIGAEVLLRWHKDGTVFSPDSFMTTIEHDAIGQLIGDFVVENTIAHMSKLNEAGFTLNVSINLFQRQLHPAAEFEKKLVSILSKYPNVNSNQLTFEILETTAISDFKQINELIDRLQRLNIQFAIDDFGTGYSSLTYFSKINARIIKIDRSFVSELCDSDVCTSTAIIESIILLSKNFNRKVIAEGIETEEQHKLLLSMGCDVGQGYKFAAPMTFAEFEKFLSSSRR